MSRPPKVTSSGYLVPDDFQQRNLELIQSIRKYLNNDESKFNQFKNYSAQFRQVLNAFFFVVSFYNKKLKQLKLHLLFKTNKQTKDQAVMLIVIAHLSNLHF